MLANLQAGLQQESELTDQMKLVQARLQTYEPGNRLLTDDQAPVELLSMRAIDKIISDELGYYKQIFREKGLTGLLEEM